MVSTTGLSVVIMTYDASDLIIKTLAHLSHQEFSTPINWEIVLVDNASTDNTIQVAQENWNNSNVPMKIVKEPRPGVAYARKTGFKNCNYEFVSFIDQDNWATPNYVEQAFLSIASKPSAGAIGVSSKAVFETEIPNWFKKYENNYAVGQQYTKSGKIDKLDGLIWGAGSIFRKEACMQLINAGYEPILSSRQGTKLLSGDESELLLLMKMCGWDIYYDDQIQIQHFMTEERLSWQYYLKLKRGLGATKVYLDLYRDLLAWVRGGTPIQKVNWVSLTWSTFTRLIKDPLAIIASLAGKSFEGNYRVSLVHFYLGELLERIHLGKNLEIIQDNLMQQLPKYPLAWKKKPDVYPV